MQRGMGIFINAHAAASCAVSLYPKNPKKQNPPKEGAQHGHGMDFYTEPANGSRHEYVGQWAHVRRPRQFPRSDRPL